MNQWISVEDRLPEADQCVDVWCQVIGGHNNGDEGRVTDCFCNEEIKCWWRWDHKCELKLHFGFDHVTHWMPLPEPPETPQ